MNRETEGLDRFDDPLREREWLLQEQAMRRERLQLDPAGDDARSRRYRLLARALRSVPTGALPADFARQMSTLVGAPVPPRRSATQLESVLATGLGGVLGLAAAVVTLIYGATWWPSFKAVLPAPAAMQWALALLGCLCLSWLLGVSTRRLKSPA